MQERDDVFEIDLKELAMTVIKKWWIILVFAILTTSIAYVYSKKMMVPLYYAETSLFLGKESSTGLSLDYSQLMAGNQLINDYSEIVKSRLVNKIVLSELGFDKNSEDITSRIGVQIIQDSRLFKISFTSDKPEIARDVANKLADVLIKMAAEIIGVKNVKIIDEAELPLAPYNISTSKNLMVGFALGIVLSLGLIFLMEILDYTFKKPEDVEKRLGVTVLGSIPKFNGEKRGKKKKNNKDNKESTDNIPEEEYTIGEISKNLITISDPKSIASEAYRTLRTNIHFSRADNPVKTIVITSPTPEDGKSTTASNLAISMAQDGKSVLLIDGDLRKPKIHRYFGAENVKGLTDVLTEDIAMHDAVKPFPEVKNLYLMVSGTIPPNPAELLGSNRMKYVLDELRLTYDVVILDMPPAVHISDAQIVKHFVDMTLMVVAQGETNIDMAIKAKKALGDVSAIVAKVSSGIGYGYGYYYY